MANMGRVELSAIDVIAVMPRCRDCHFWDALDMSGAEQTGICHRVDFDGGSCDDQTRACISIEQPNGRISVSGDVAWFVTRQDFGCVQFQAREESRAGVSHG